MADVLPLIQASLTALKGGALPPTDVVKALISKAMGYGIIVGSTLVKVPQISNVVRARSAEGLSAAAFELESWGLLVHAAYGAVSRLPFSSYGEAAILLAQNLLLLALVYRYAGTSVARVGGVFGVLAAAVAVLASGRVPRAAVARLYEANNAVMLAARVPQIAKNFAAKSTGQLSLVTFGVNAAGCVARIFTSLQEGGGAAMVRAYCLGLALNATLVAQILAYGGGGGAKGAKAGAKGGRGGRAPSARTSRAKKAE